MKETCQVPPEAAHVPEPSKLTAPSVSTIRFPLIVLFAPRESTQSLFQMLSRMFAPLAHAVPELAPQDSSCACADAQSAGTTSVYTQPGPSGGAGLPASASLRTE